MTGKRLEGLDLNLLLALHWLLAERNVTAASVKLGLSQPAASRALGRLRDIFDDPLLVKVGGEMSPTPLAERIQPQLAHAIDRCRDVLRVSGEFHPAEQSGRFRMACPDYIGVLASSIWHDFVRPEAPQMSLDLLTPTLETARDMVTGRIDMCVLPDIVALDLPASVDPESFVQKPVLDQQYLCAVRKDHPLAGKKVTIDDYCALDHVLVAPEGKSSNIIERELEKIGRTRNVRYRAQTFLMGVPIVLYTDSVVTAPSPLIDLRSDELYVFEPPVRLPSHTMYAVWHPNWTHDARHKWFREQIMGAISREPDCPLMRALITRSKGSGDD